MTTPQCVPFAHEGNERPYTTTLIREEEAFDYNEWKILDHDKQ